MANNNTPVGYYDRYDRDAKKWKKLLFNPGKALQSAELNEIQSVLQDEHTQIANTIYDEGAIVEGMAFTLDLESDPRTINMTAGKFYVAGIVHDIPAGELEITGIGTETVGIRLTPVAVTEVDDPDLNDPAVGSENYGWSGSHRLVFESEFVLNEEDSVTVCTIQDGQIVQTRNQPRPVMDKILRLLASRTYDESGSYAVQTFKASVQRADASAEASIYDYKLRVKVSGGRAYVKGWRVENNAWTTLIDRTVKQAVDTNPNTPDVYEAEFETQPVNSELSCTFQDTGDTVTRNNHGRSDNDIIYFSKIRNTTGISIFTPYYIISATTHTFKVSNTYGGSALPLTVDGTDDGIGAYIYGTSNLTYTLFNNYINEIPADQGISCKVQTASYPKTRGASNEDSLLTGSYPDMASVYTIDEVFKWTNDGDHSQGRTVYVTPDDYSKVNNTIVWTAEGDHPTVGTTYYVVATYPRDMVKGIRVLTDVTSESVVRDHTNGNLVDTLDYPDVQAIVQVHDGAETVYTDYTIDYSKGKITWTGGASKPDDSATYYVDYNYWTHSVEGDYLSRDSFVDSEDAILRYNTPVYTRYTNVAINYKNQITFETSSGNIPKAGTDISVTYTYVVPRIDVLSIDYKGILSVLRGVPAPTPTTPVCADESLRICSFYLPPEATPEVIKITYFDNKTLTMVDLRSMLRTLKNLVYNDTVFQLQQEVLTKPLPTDKRGVIADNYRSSLLSDAGNANYNCTLDFLAGRCYLPQTTESFSLFANVDTTTAVYKDNYWMLPYTHAEYIKQAYATEPMIVNDYTIIGLNARAKVFPEVDRWTDNEKFTFTTVIPGETSYENVDVTNVQQRPRHWFLLDFLRALFGLGPRDTSVLMPRNDPLSRLVPLPIWVIWSAWNYNHRTTINVDSTIEEVITDPGWTDIINSISFSSIPFARNIYIGVLGEEFIPGETVECFFDGNLVPFVTPSYEYVQDGAHSPKLVNEPSLPVTIKDVLGPFSEPPPTGDDGSIACSPPKGVGLPTIADGKVEVPTNGKWFAYFQVPDGTRTGTHSVEVVGSGSDEYPAYTPTYIATEFTSEGTLKTIYENITIKLPSRKIVTTTTRTITTPPRRRIDPLAQTFFTLDAGYISKLDLFFHTKPVTDTVIVEIQEVLVGFPTGKILGQAILNPSDISVDATNGLTATSFVFETPVYVEAEKEYAFIVLTEDTNAKLWVARMNGVDPTKGWVNANPYTGILFKSANASTWSPIQDADIKFTLYRCDFTTSASLDFEDITFVSGRNRFEMTSMCVEPGNDTHVRYQYSINDGATWEDFTPPIEVDTSVLYTDYKFRALLLGTQFMSPIVYDNNAVHGSRWEYNGKYICRSFWLDPGDQAGSLHVWVNTKEPSGTTVTVDVCYDGGLVNYVEVPYQPDDDKWISLDGWYEKHFLLEYEEDEVATEFPYMDNVTPNTTGFHIRIAMTSDNHAITPELSGFRACANDLPPA